MVDPRLLVTTGARTAPADFNPVWLTAVVVPGLVILGFVIGLMRTRWWKIYAVVDHLVHAANPDSRHFPRIAQQWIRGSEVPRQYHHWLTVLVIYHMQRVPRRHRRTWRVVWRIWRHRHVHEVPRSPICVMTKTVDGDGKKT